MDNSSGRVKYCQYRTWGSVCNNEWDDRDARVVCGQLGFNCAGNNSRLRETHIKYFLYLAEARAEEGFGGGEGIPVFVDHVDCDGSELEIEACRKRTASPGCQNAGVTCIKSESESFRALQPLHSHCWFVRCEKMH